MVVAAQANSRAYRTDVSGNCNRRDPAGVAQLVRAAES
jgi:hypothetical protein